MSLQLNRLSYEDKSKILVQVKKMCTERDGLSNLFHKYFYIQYNYYIKLLKQSVKAVILRTIITKINLTLLC